MATRISRRKLATHAAKRIASGDSVQAVLDEMAAYLTDARRKNEAELVVRDIEIALLSQGIVLGTAVSARPLTDVAKNELEAYVKSAYVDVKTVTLREVVDTSVIAGVRLELPDKQLDSTVASKLEKLKVAL